MGAARRKSISDEPRRRVLEGQEAHRLDEAERRPLDVLVLIVSQTAFDTHVTIARGGGAHIDTDHRKVGERRLVMRSCSMGP